MNSLEHGDARTVFFRKHLVCIVFLFAGIVGLFAVMAEFYEKGMGGGLYHKAMVASLMFYAASDVNRLSQKFTSYVKSSEPASRVTLALQLISGILFLLWITSS